MSRENGGSRRWWRLGCGCALVVGLAVASFVLYGLWTAPVEAPELTTEEREAARSKLVALEESLRGRRSFETQFSAAELTLLAQQHLDRRGIEGEVEITLPEDDLKVSFRTTVAELERFVDLEGLPRSTGSEIWGSVQVHPTVVDGEPRADLESVSLYGVPLPLGFLGPAAEKNWLERLDADSAAVLRQIRSLQIRDGTLFVTTE